jgi:predicted DNA-binding transcriptional regulator YafY
VLATLPASLRERAQQLGERFHLDAPGWFHHEEPLAHLAQVASAVWRQRRLRVRYRSADAPVARLLEPLGLVLKAGVWYAVAAVVDSGDRPVRSYRVSRIVEAELTGEEFERPPGFDLAEFWARSSAEFDRSILRDRIRIRVAQHALRILAAHTDRAAAAEAIAAAGPPDAEGWIELELAVESVSVARHQITALGGDVEVLDPPSLRAALAEIGEKMAARNAAPDTDQR